MEEIFATWVSNENVRDSSSSGGAFSALAVEVIGAGGIVYGAAFDKDFNVVHRGVETVEALASLRSSKYVFSSFASVLPEVKSEVESGRRVLFSGVPCQIAALRKMLGREYDNLLCVEVICHGSPSAGLWNLYLDRLCQEHHRRRSDIAAISFRDKSTGWKTYSFTVRFSDGSAVSHPYTDNPYMMAFLRDLSLREGCFRCPFKRGQSGADITLGDFWGVETVAPSIDNNRGVSLVIVHTARGRKAAANLRRMASVDEHDVIIHNPSYARTAKEPPARKPFLKMLAKKSDPIAAMRIYIERKPMKRLKLRLKYLFSR